MNSFHICLHVSKKCSFVVPQGLRELLILICPGKFYLCACEYQVHLLYMRSYVPHLRIIKAYFQNGIWHSRYLKNSGLCLVTSRTSGFQIVVLLIRALSCNHGVIWDHITRRPMTYKFQNCSVVSYSQLKINLSFTSWKYSQYIRIYFIFSTYSSVKTMFLTLMGFR